MPGGGDADCRQFPLKAQHKGRFALVVFPPEAQSALFEAYNLLWFPLLVFFPELGYLIVPIHKIIRQFLTELAGRGQ